jgi:hypothetical protein
MSTILVEDPVGVQSIAINEKNPYKKICEEEYEKTLEETDIIMYIPTELLETVEEVERYARIVKLITLFDFFTSMFYYFSSQFWYAYTVSIISLFGYLSTHNFNKSYIIGYMCYQYMAAMVKTIFTIVVYYNWLFCHTIIVNENTFYFLPINSIIQWFMFNYVKRFYNVLPTI